MAAASACASRRRALTALSFLVDSLGGASAAGRAMPAAAKKAAPRLPAQVRSEKGEGG